MADIRIAVDFFDHPKTQMLQADHGLEAVVSLMRLWQWAAVNRSKGILRGIDRKRISIVARCSLEVVEALISTDDESRFIDENSRGLSLHNWKKRQGYIFHSEERSEKARKAAKARYAPKSLDKEGCSEHATRSIETVLKQDSSTAPSPDPDPSPVPTPKPKTKPKPPAVEIPESLQTDSFKTAWAEWETHRRELGLKKYKPLGQKQLFTKLSKWGSDRAVAAIYFSMGQNYQGIFEEKGGNGKQKQKSVSDIGREMMLEEAERVRNGETRGDGFTDGPEQRLLPGHAGEDG